LTGSWVYKRVYIKDVGREGERRGGKEEEGGREGGGEYDGGGG